MTKAEEVRSQALSPEFIGISSSFLNFLFNNYLIKI